MRKLSTVSQVFEVPVERSRIKNDAMPFVLATAKHQIKESEAELTLIFLRQIKLSDNATQKEFVL